MGSNSYLTLSCSWLLSSWLGLTLKISTLIWTLILSKRVFRQHSNLVRRRLCVSRLRRQDQGEMRGVKPGEGHAEFFGTTACLVLNLNSLSPTKTSWTRFWATINYLEVSAVSFHYVTPRVWGCREQSEADCRWQGEGCKRLLLPKPLVYF